MCRIMDFLLKLDSHVEAVDEGNVSFEEDNTTVFLQEGQYIVPLSGRTVFLKDEDGVLQQYVVGESYEKSENPIVYYANEDESALPYSYVFENSEENATEGDSDVQPICEYAILKDGRLHLQTVQVEELPTDENASEIDLNEITGRNLVTGQTVTLDRYLDKLHSVESREDDGDLINRKVTIGKTANGKKIVGKILHFQSSESLDKRSSQEERHGRPGILHKRRVLTRENCDDSVRKTLVGLMDMESVRNRLRHKDLVVKLVDKVYSSQMKKFTKTISFVYGHMELANGDWSFEVHDANDAESPPDDEPKSIVFVTIVSTVDGYGKKSMRVNLIPSLMRQTKCYKCGKQFKSSQQVRRHVINAHLTDESRACDRCGKSFANGTLLERHKRTLSCQKSYECSVCPKSFNSAGSLKRHLTVHDPSLRPLECTVCAQRFTDESSLRKHLVIHTGIRAYTCNVCTRSFRNRGDLNFHRRIHDPVKQFCCEVCGRAFSRYSNMLRHTEIHRGMGTLHRCDICGIAYSFVASLTRHIVQKHLSSEQTE